MRELTEANFQESIASGNAIVDCWAPWCGPCKMFMPIIEAASEIHQDISFFKVDVDTAPGIAQKFGIRSVPTLMAFQNGELKIARSGAMDPASLEAFFAEAFNK
ncbi:MAG: thioredoxin [Rickettsiales bacterium]|jgi:thioredoxin 1|nr:thioredoxin [Rickettsiales bacterium]